MLHTSSTCVDVRPERPETTTKKTTETTANLHSQPSLGHASPCMDVRPERPEKMTTDYRPEQNVGKAIETIPRPRPNPRDETLRQRLRDRLPPPDIPDSGLISNYKIVRYR